MADPYKHSLPLSLSPYMDKHVKFGRPMFNSRSMCRSVPRNFLRQGLTLLGREHGYHLDVLSCQIQMVRVLI